MSKEDTKMIQDIRIAQNIVKEAIARHPDDNLTINIVNVQIGSSSIEKPIESQPQIEAKKALLLDTPSIEFKSSAAIPDEIYHVLETVMQSLPKPRHDSLIRMMYETAYRKFNTTREMAEWLGVERSALYPWFKKLGLPLKGLSDKGQER